MGYLHNFWQSPSFSLPPSLVFSLTRSRVLTAFRRRLFVLCCPSRKPVAYNLSSKHRTSLCSAVFKALIKGLLGRDWASWQGASVATANWEPSQYRPGRSASLGPVVARSTGAWPTVRESLSFLFSVQWRVWPQREPLTIRGHPQQPLNPQHLNNSEGIAHLDGFTMDCFPPQEWAGHFGASCSFFVCSTHGSYPCTTFLWPVSMAGKSVYFRIGSSERRWSSPNFQQQRQPSSVPQSSLFGLTVPYLTLMMQYDGVTIWVLWKLYHS